MKTKPLRLTRNQSKTLFLIFIGFTWFANVSAEVVPGTTLSVNFESANIVGSGRNVNMHRIPVIDINTGATTFFDATFRFTFTPGVGFEFVTISSAAISPPLSTSNLIPGTYKDQFGRTYSLEGPSALPDNRLLYTLKGTSSNNRLSAQIITGPANGHPDIGEREIVPFLPNTFIYGLVADNGNGTFLNWETNELIGLRQNGNILSVSLFSEGKDNNDNPVDFSTQRDSVTLTKEIQ